MSRWFNNLSVKLTIGLVGSMMVVFIALGYQSVRLHRQDMEGSVILAADRISDIIKRSTRHSMLKNDREEVYYIITTIGKEQGINKIRIFNEEGKISFSTDNRETNTLVDKKAEACTACHAQEKPITRLNRPDRIRIYSINGGRILGLINPIENEPACSGASCHVHPSEKQVLGVLDVTMSLSRVDETIAAGQKKLVANFFGATLIVSLVFAGLIVSMVHKPVKQLISGTKHVASGDLSYSIPESSGDEIGKLASSFNRMTHELKNANAQLTEWAKTLESRIEQKTAELKRTHEQMLQVERMASIGKLAAIVAHEINNPLAGILTYAKLLLRKIQSGTMPGEELAKTKQALETIASESARCGDIVKNLLQFARPASMNLKPENVNELILQSMRLVQHKIDLMNMKTLTALDENLPAIVCDAQQIKQAIVALLINACEALKQDEGVLQIASRAAPEKNGVEIRIHDNGVGMDDETQKHVFEPFFTTKEEGTGLGIGLSVVYTIANHHHGDVSFTSTPGGGTTFISLSSRNTARAKGR